MPANTSAFSAFIAPDVHEMYVETGKERPPEYDLWMNVGTLDYNPVTDKQVAGLGTLVDKPEGTMFSLDDPIMGGSKTYTATAGGLAFECTWEMWRDDLYGLMMEFARELARSGRYREEISGHSVLNNAFSNSYTGFTAGESLCHTSHARLDGGTAQANRPSVDVGFSFAGIQAGIQNFHRMLNERGLPRVMAPSMAIIAPQNLFAAREILGSSGKPYTADNEINSLVAEDLSWMVSHYLTDENYWFLLAPKGVHNLNYYWRDRPIFDNFDDPWTKSAVFTVYQRHTQGYGSYRGVYGSTG